MPGPTAAGAADLLRAYAPADAGQRRLRDEYLAFLAEHPDGLRRTCTPDHLTASALVVSENGRRVLLHRHAKVGRWLQFGGHLEDGDADLPAAALREAREESGLPAGLNGLRLLAGPAGDAAVVRLDRHAAPCDPGRVRHHLDVQLAAVAPGDALPRPEAAESQDVAWFDATGLPADTDASVRALVAAACALLAVSPPAPPGPGR